jgi:hypothetical protein
MPVRKEDSSRKDTTVPDRQAPSPKPQPPTQKEEGSRSEKPEDKNGLAAEQKILEPLKIGESTHQFLGQLIEKISSVSEELSGIRQLLEKGALSTTHTGPESRSPSSTQPLIPLDFEAFLIDQKTKDENSAES